MSAKNMPEETGTVSTCRLCGQPTKVNGQGLPTYHAKCAEIAGVHAGPKIGRLGR